MTENTYEDLSGSERCCMHCGVPESGMDGDPVLEEQYEIDGFEFDAPHTRVFCSNSCRDAYDGV